MSTIRADFSRTIIAAFLVLLAAAASAQTASVQPSRVVVAGRGAALVVDAVYAFPGLRSRVAATVKPDQGFGLFLSAVDPGFPAKAVLDRNAGAESYAATKGDLFVMKSYVRSPLGVSLEALGLKTMYVDLESPEDYYRDIQAIGSAFGQAERADELVGYYRELQADTERRVAGAARPRVLLAQAAEGGRLWEVAPASWMQARLVDLSGGENVGSAERGSAWMRVGAEQLAAWKPDVVIAVSYNSDSAAAAEAFRADPRFGRVPAVISGRVHAMPQDFYSWDQADTRWIIGLRRIAAFIHPDRFADVDSSAEARRFFELLYGMDKTRFDAVILPRLKGEHGVE
ncbi:MAG: hypothetical protein A2Z99_15685 [Treponema sp. GWB1_62_6]|nr:MAG: hypothetical protein A2Y36_14045 [Treponema sp. GWA1_62_8]OHE65948.1 MAG: hypothetical protein A2001_15975 [Treponema sp. GWC1_61_84]OHE68840.1 MAG: hypothetical protein A2Z99_15685 [Treponema sp. GWB1_62_6]OHE73349.1 MAG: hypothetical protein A2413_00535 [Treponema sp. RIFOXYC1_FULL_61_9]HCM28211.1 hypothetical protein [Treponema sp.]